MPDRIVRDELWRNYRFVGLAGNDPRILFLALLNLADDYGNASAHPLSIKSASLIFASWDNSVVIQHLNTLHDADLIRMYQEGGESYLHIPRFKQRLRGYKAKHPRPPSGIECKEINGLGEKVRPEQDSSPAQVRPQTLEEKRREEKRSEGKGRELPKRKAPGGASRSPKTVMPENFTISARVQDWASKNGHRDLPQHLESFRLKCEANGYTYADWDAALMGAIRDDWAKLNGRTGRRKGAIDADGFLASMGEDKTIDGQITDVTNRSKPEGIGNEKN